MKLGKSLIKADIIAALLAIEYFEQNASLAIDNNKTGHLPRPLTVSFSQSIHSPCFGE